MNEQPTPDKDLGAIKAALEPLRKELGALMGSIRSKARATLPRQPERLKIETTPEELDAEASAIAEDLRAKATEAAETAVKERVTVSITESGKVRRNGPCPCGSGRKFKKCCLREVQDPESDKNLPTPRVLRHYINEKRKRK